MKTFFIYAGILAIIYGASAAFFLCKNYATPADRNSAADMVIFVGGAVFIGLLLGGGATMILWKRFVLADITISNTAWILAAFCLLSLIQGGLSFGINFIHPPKQQVLPDEIDQKPHE